MVRQKGCVKFCGVTELDIYNGFCKGLAEGYILYNVNKGNRWGEYLLVADVATVTFCGNATYSVLLLGLKKKNGKIVPNGIKVNLTPDHACDVPFLKYVGHCAYRLVPELGEVNINTGLATVYGSADLRKFASKLSIRKPKNRKYGNDGNLIVRDASNEKGDLGK